MSKRISNSNLNTRLLGYSLTAVATLAGINQSEAQSIEGELVNHQINLGETYPLVFKPSSTLGVKFSFCNLNYLTSGGNYAKAMYILNQTNSAKWIKINANSDGKFVKAVGVNYFVTQNKPFGNNNGSGFIASTNMPNGFWGNLNGYIGVRFKFPDASIHLGWIRIFVNNTTSKVLSYAYQTATLTTIQTDGILPVEFTSFTAANKGGKVSLDWNTATEVNNYGFEIERNTYPDFENGSTQTNEWQKIGFIQGAGNSNSPKDYKFTDAYPPSGLVMYRLKQIDNDGKFVYSDISTVEISKPVNFDLGQNYPNPFNPSTAISYSIPNDAKVLLKVFDMLGKEVATLVNEDQTAGIYKVDFNGANLPSGTYTYRITAGDFTQTKKLLLLK